MKRTAIIALMFLATAGFAAAQGPGYSPSTDVLGAHLNYGRGCPACHAPHSGAYGNGAAGTADATSGNIALWGQDVMSLVGQTIITGGGSYSETLPSLSTGSPDATGLLTCLSCHDGNYATGAMMKNQVYETLPASYGTKNVIPTLLGNDNGTGGTKGNYLNDHPVGTNAVFSCNNNTTISESGYNWDCTIALNSKGAPVVTYGPNMTKFVANYGFFVSLGNYNGTPIVVCTTCHNQHLMNVVKVTNGANSGLASGTYQTMFFIRAPYNPGTTTAASNQNAQFCRQCHGGESNEMNGGTAVTTF